MDKKKSLTRVFWYQGAGFLVIIALCFLDEFLSLSSMILHGHPYLHNFGESTVKMLLILAVWLIVVSSTRRLLLRVRQLEEFLRVCAWCHRIDFKGRWMPIEEFFQQGFDTPTTHGICPICLERNKAAIKRARETAEQPASV
jgi:hypothetical protein